MTTVLSSQRFTPYASHMSLFLSDRENHTDVDYSGWGHRDAELQRVLVAPFELQIATARYDVVPVRLRVLSAPPTVEPGAEHVVEVDLQVPSGRLVLHTASADWEAVIPMEPGGYRVRITYTPRAGPPSEVGYSDAPGDHFDYTVDLWLSPRPKDPATLVQGREVWAG